MLRVYPRVLFLDGSPTGMLSKATCLRNLGAGEADASVSVAIRQCTMLVRCAGGPYDARGGGFCGKGKRGSKSRAGASVTGTATASAGNGKGRRGKRWIEARGGAAKDKTLATRRGAHDDTSGSRMDTNSV